MIDKIKYFYVKKIYADHNDSKVVKVRLHQLLADLEPSAVCLNVGAGKTNIDPRFKNMEIEKGEGIDLIGSVEAIPSEGNFFDLVITQEVLEHVKSPHLAMQEIYRVLKPNGMAYIQLPFIIGYHPCPNDYWRFTHEGIVELVKSAGFEVTDVGLTVGPAVGLYRVAVEFFSIFTSAFWGGLYKPTKLIFSLLLYPIKWLDPLMRRSREMHRIAGGFFVVCQKR
jgi:SAM-dependent methyltransferase